MTSTQQSPLTAGGSPVDPRVLDLLFQLMGEVFRALPRWAQERLLVDYRLVSSEIPASEAVDGAPEGGAEGSLMEARGILSRLLEIRLRQETRHPEVMAVALDIVTGMTELSSGS